MRSFYPGRGAAFRENCASPGREVTRAFAPSHRAATFRITRLALRAQSLSMSTRKQNPVDGNTTPGRAQYDAAIALIRSRSPVQRKLGRKQLDDLADEGQIDTLEYFADWCRTGGQLEWAEAWALYAYAGGESFQLIEVAYEWIFGKDGWDRSLFKGPTTRGRDPRRGLKLLNWAARRGDVGAVYYLAQLYQNGGSFPSDDRRALAWTRRGVALGDEDCITDLGVRYFYGRGVRRDWKRAHELYRRAAAIGGASAAFNLGLQYEHGDGVRKNARLAAQWMKRAAELDTTSGWLRLADYYFDGHGVPRSRGRALGCLRRAGSRGEREIATRKLWGKGLALDVKGGRTFLLARIRAGDIDAMTALADWYHDVKEDYARAADLYRRAARKGNSDAMTSLHDCLSDGHPHLVKNDRVALRWLRRAIALDFDGAYYRMGERLVAGKGVKRNVPKGLRFIRRSMEQHIGNAFQAMGQLLLARARTRAQVQKALEHFLEARRLGVDQVEAEISECRKRLRAKSGRRA
jgi:TPR repeat protein